MISHANKAKAISAKLPEEMGRIRKKREETEKNGNKQKETRRNRKKQEETG